MLPPPRTPMLRMPARWTTPTEAGSDDASVADVSVSDDAADESIGDEESPADASAGDETIGDESAGDEVSTTAAIEPGIPGPADVIFTIRADRGVHPISPLIYGNERPPELRRQWDGTASLRGNRWTAFDWENGASNAGKDSSYQNDDNLATSDAPGSAVLTTIKTAIAYRALPLVTVPIVNFVAYDKAGDGDVRMTPDYWPPVSKRTYPPSKLRSRQRPMPPIRTSSEDEFVSWAKGVAAGAPSRLARQRAGSFGPHPSQGAPQQGHLRRARVARHRLRACHQERLAGGEGLGFVSSGWSGFTSLQGAPDADEKGDFIEYYLDKMMDAECFHHRRLIDYLDLHWYSEIRAGRTRITSAQATAPVAEARLQAPRSLWDPTFIEDTWITGRER